MARLLRMALVMSLAFVACGDDSDPCANGVLDSGEVGVDCGGACGLCPGESCSADAICASDVCVGGQCAVPSCMDGRENGTETGVDCGGSCSACTGPSHVTTEGPDTQSIF